MTHLYSTHNESSFHDKFISYGRQENFTYEGRQALFEHLEQLAEDTGEPIELDVIALCCEYSEYQNFEEFAEEYGEGFDFETWDDVADHTIIIHVGDEGAVVGSF